MIALVKRQQGQIAELTASNAEMRKQVAELQRGGKRQAAAFSKGSRASKPQRPAPSQVWGCSTTASRRARHRNEEVREVVPSEYGGVMVTDRGWSCDAQALSGVRQQKCLAHVLHSISEVVQTKKGRGRSFGRRLSGLLREAMGLRQGISAGSCGGGRAVETSSSLPSARPSDVGCGQLQVALLEERGRSGCVLGVHQRDQDVGTQWWRPTCGGLALRCVQRRSHPLPFLLNVSTYFTPLVNYILTFGAAPPPTSEYERKVLYKVLY